MIPVENLDPKHAQATPEQVEVLVKFLKRGLENLVGEQKCRGIDPVVAVYCYDPLKGQNQMRVHLMDTGFNTPLEKKISMKTVAATIYKERLFPVAVGLTSEAWVSHQSKEEAEGPRKHLMPSDDPERKEIAIAVAVGMHRSSDRPPLTAHDMRYMARDKDNVVSWDGDWLFQDEKGEAMESGLIDQFFRGYVGFAKGDEDPESYLHGKKVVPLNEHHDSDS